MASKSIDEQARILVGKFQKKGKELDSLLAVAIKEASIKVESDAVLFSPVDTGLLRKSINHRIIERNGYPVGQIGTNVEHAPFQEFGTSKMSPQPFLLPSLNKNRSVVQMIVTRRLKQAL